MRADQAALQLGALLGRDVRGRERAESGRDAVGGRARVRQLLDAHAGRADRGHGIRSHGDRAAVPGDADDLVEGHRPDADEHRTGLECVLDHHVLQAPRFSFGGGQPTMVSDPGQVCPSSPRRRSTGGIAYVRSGTRRRTARHDADREVVADRGGPAHADEQPRPRGRRAARGSGGLRRHRTGRAQLGGVRRDRAHPHRARGRRDAARAVGQAGRGVPHPRVGAAGADRQLQPGRRLGDLARVPSARGARPDHVRPDDGRVVDLHRHAGHPAGHVRDLRGDRGEAVRRHPGRHGHADRRMRRHGRRAAARRDDERGRGADRRRRPHHDSSAASTTATSTSSPTTSTTRSRGCSRPRPNGGRCRSGWSGMRRRCSRNCCAAASRSTSSPTRPVRTTR